MAEWNAAKSQSRLGAEVIRLDSGRLSRKGGSADDWGRWAEKSIMVKLMSVVMKMSGGKRVVNERMHGHTSVWSFGGRVFLCRART